MNVQSMLADDKLEAEGLGQESAATNGRSADSPGPGRKVKSPDFA